MIKYLSRSIKLVLHSIEQYFKLFALQIVTTFKISTVLLANNIIQILRLQTCDSPFTMCTSILNKIKSKQEGFMLITVNQAVSALLFCTELKSSNNLESSVHPLKLIDSIN